MFSVPDFLDRAKSGAGVDSDYALAVKVLGHKNQARVSGWRREISAPDDSAILALCALSGDDPEHVAACIQSMRAANDDTADLWRRVADRLKRAGANVFLLPAVAIVCIAALPHSAEAAPAFAQPATGVSLYIMLNQSRTRASGSLGRITPVSLLVTDVVL